MHWPKLVLPVGAVGGMGGAQRASVDSNQRKVSECDLSRPCVYILRSYLGQHVFGKSPAERALEIRKDHEADRRVGPAESWRISKIKRLSWNGHDGLVGGSS